MSRRASTALAIALTVVPVAGTSEGLRDQPRAIDLFAQVSGYADLAPDRFGEPAAPAPNELGTVLLSRIFRTVCLGLENGMALEAVMPPGFSAEMASEHYWGDAEDAPNLPNLGTVLSVTGFIDTDEAAGHPWITIRPHPDGTDCKIDWKIPGTLQDQTMANMADVLVGWLPYEYALVSADRPFLGQDPSWSNSVLWDRPCGDRWCSMSTLYGLGRGEVQISTVINLTDIQGERP